MKAIILAAGRGTRLNKYTQDMPKGMLKLFGKPLIQYQIDVFRKYNINEIVLVKGYMPEKISFPGLKYYINCFYETTNMVESLFAAKNELRGDVIVSYSDIIFDSTVIERVLQDDHDISVVVDVDWKNYWKKRYGTIDFDTETLVINKSGYITELGKENPEVEGIDARYVGLIKFSEKGIRKAKDIYDNGKKKFQGAVWLNGRDFEKIFMTDFLQEIIDQGNLVHAIKIKNGWLEFDTNDDYEKAIEWHKNSEFGSLINLDK